MASSPTPYLPPPNSPPFPTNNNPSCDVPIFANTITTKCKQCEADLTLRINPRLVRSPFPHFYSHHSPLPSLTKKRADRSPSRRNRRPNKRKTHLVRLNMGTTPRPQRRRTGSCYGECAAAEVFGESVAVFEVGYHVWVEWGRGEDCGAWGEYYLMVLGKKGWSLPWEVLPFSCFRWGHFR